MYVPNQTQTGKAKISQTENNLQIQNAKNQRWLLTSRGLEEDKLDFSLQILVRSAKNLTNPVSTNQRFKLIHF